MATAKKKNTAKKNKKNQGKKNGASPRLSALGVSVILAVCGVLLLILFIAVSPSRSISGVGVLLQAIVKMFASLLGAARFTLPFYLLLLAFAFFRKRNEEFRFARFIVFSTVLFLVFPAFFSIDQRFVDFGSFMTVAAGGSGGGVLGGVLAYGMLRLLTEPLSVVLLIFLALVSVLMLVNFSFRSFFAGRKDALAEKYAERKEAREQAKAEAEAEASLFDGAEGDESGKTGLLSPGKARREREQLPAPGKRKRKVVEYADENRVIIDGMVFTKDPGEGDFTPVTFREHLTGRSEIDDIAPVYDDDEKDPDMDLVAGLYGGLGDEDIHTGIFSPESIDAHIYDEELEPPADETDLTAFEEIVPDEDGETESDSEEFEVDPENPEKKAAMSHFCLPKTSILEKGDQKNRKQSAQDIRASVKKLESTLESFGVQARVTDVNVGPSLIRYEVQPGPGVKVSRIVGLTDDIALQLAAANVRMEAPIPGKSVIGIEVPRKDTVTVYFREILENSRFFEMSSKLTCAYGQDIAGNPVIGDLASMPHLLIAGTTGSGKSVCMNTMICSILFKATPDQVKFIMIDPKQVEFVIYEGLPHLITPVVTDPKKAAGALKWALREMENRYTLFNQNRVRNIFGYNQLAAEEDQMPQIVIFIDELADLMMVAAKDVEASICRLAQKARAAGIHLVIATQRPSVDVITGLIKANIPSRIALSVSSQTDSRTILDVGGAEKLLGRGDMLYMPVGYSKPLRVQGAWLSDSDAAAILDHYKKQGEPDYVEGVAQAVDTGGKKEADYGDALFFDAARAAITAGQASTSMMQRRFRIGYNHAARIMEELEEKGVIGPADGAKPRTVLMSLEAFKETFKEPEEPSLFDEE